MIAVLLAVPALAALVVVVWHYHRRTREIAATLDPGPRLLVARPIARRAPMHRRDQGRPGRAVVLAVVFALALLVAAVVVVVVLAIRLGDPPPAVEEDQPGWDCATQGNGTCGLST